MTAVYGSDAENYTDAVNLMLGADKFTPVEQLMLDEPARGVIFSIYLVFNALAGSKSGQPYFEMGGKTNINMEDMIVAYSMILVMPLRFKSDLNQ